MTPAIMLAVLALVLPSAARADIYVRSPWGFLLVMPTGPCSYCPGRIQRGFQAPPVEDPYGPTIEYLRRPPPNYYYPPMPPPQEFPIK